MAIKGLQFEIQGMHRNNVQILSSDSLETKLDTGLMALYYVLWLAGKDAVPLVVLDAMWIMCIRVSAPSSHTLENLDLPSFYHTPLAALPFSMCSL